MTLLIVLINFSALPGPAQNIPLQEGIHFRWAFGAIKNTPQGSHFEVISRDASLKSGDRIKFFIQRQNRCFVYLFYRNTQDEISVLFPYRFKTSLDRSSVLVPYYIPAKNQWFELDQQEGLERFYLLASSRRLFALEALVNHYESSHGPRKAQLAQQVLGKIRELRKQHMQFKIPAERPLSVIGNMRGSKKAQAATNRDLSNFSIEVSAKYFYSRSFTIDHQ